MRAARGCCAPAVQNNGMLMTHGKLGFMQLGLVSWARRVSGSVQAAEESWREQPHGASVSCSPRPTDVWPLVVALGTLRL